MNSYYEKRRERRSEKRLLFKRPISFLLLFLAFLLSVRPAAAHSDGAILRLSEAQAGPFTVNVWTYPSFLVPGTVHFSVSVVDTVTRDPLPATAVFVQVSPREAEKQTAPVNSRATLDFQTLLHETYLDIQEPGEYQVTVQVAASTEQQGQVAFDMKVVSGTAYRMMIVAFIAVTIIAVIWFLKEGLTTWGIARWIRNKQRAQRAVAERG